MFRSGLSYLKAPFSVGFIYLLLFALPIEWILYVLKPFLNDLAETLTLYETIIQSSQSVSVDFVGTFNALAEQHHLGMLYLILAGAVVFVCSVFSKSYLMYVAHNTLTLSQNAVALPPKRQLLPRLFRRAELETYFRLFFKVLFLPFAVGLVFLLFWVIFGLVALLIGFGVGSDHTAVFSFLLTDGLWFMSVFGAFYILAYSFYFVRDFQLRAVFFLKRNFLFIRRHWLKMIITLGIMAGSLFLLGTLGLLIARVLFVLWPAMPDIILIPLQMVFVVYAQLLLSIIFGKCLFWIQNKVERGKF